MVSAKEIARVKKENQATFRAAGVPMSKENLTAEDVSKLNSALNKIRSGKKEEKMYGKTPMMKIKAVKSKMAAQAGKKKKKKDLY